MKAKGAEFYEFRVRGHLDSHWSDWFEGLTVTPLENGDTLINGPIRDQAALHGILTKIRDLGLYLLSVVCVELEPEEEINVGKTNTSNMVNSQTSQQAAQSSHAFKGLDRLVGAWEESGERHGQVIFEWEDDTLTVSIETAGRKGKIRAKFNDDYDTLTGNLKWTQDGVEMGYNAVLTRIKN